MCLECGNISWIKREELVNMRLSPYISQMPSFCTILEVDKEVRC
jgi:hypothetical protein